MSADEEDKERREEVAIVLEHLAARVKTNMVMSFKIDWDGAKQVNIVEQRTDKIKNVTITFEVKEKGGG